MATYKVIQDIEAEDHILGPLTLRQFIYGIITALLLYFCFLVVVKHVAFLLILFLPPAAFTGFLAFPFGGDQPTEVWALAKIRFLFKPRMRIWNQSGVKELVTITAPKKIERAYTDGLSQTEVRSRLSALANTIDSRGWAVKNININLYGQAAPIVGSSSDRLIDISNLPQSVPEYDIAASDDILDEHNNPVAQQFDQMIHASTTAHRQQLINELNGVPAAQPQGAAASQADYWFLNKPVQPPKLAPNDAVFAKAQVVQPGTDSSVGPAAVDPTADETALVEKLKQQNASQQAIMSSHLRTVQPLDSSATALQNTPASPPSPATPDPAILDLASNNDLNVATLAREAKKAKGFDGPDDEVVISLH